MTATAPLEINEGAVFTDSWKFNSGRGRIPLGDWSRLGLPCYSGTMVMEKSFTLPDPVASLTLDLGRVFATAEVKCNGKPCGIRVWHPYRFDLTDAARIGENQLEITLCSTVGPFFNDGNQSIFSRKSQLKSRVYGPVRLFGGWAALCIMQP